MEPSLNTLPLSNIYKVVRLSFNMFQQNHVPWNKGLTKENNEKILKQTANLNLFYHTESGLKKRKQQSEMMKIKNPNDIPRIRKKLITAHWTKNGKYTKEEIKYKLSTWQKGKTYDEKYGTEEALLKKKKASEKVKGKTYEEIFGTERARMIKEKMSKSNKIVMNKPEIKKKIRINVIKYIQNHKSLCSPRIGKNEKQILDNWESMLNYKIYRQYLFETLGYFVDGYIKELNWVIEIDEVPKIKEKDILREKEIKEEIGCIFIRIPDY